MRVNSSGPGYQDSKPSGFVGVFVREAAWGFLCSTVKAGIHIPLFAQQAWFLQCSPLPGAAAALSVQLMFFFFFLIVIIIIIHTVFCFDCYQLAESTFSTCAIQRCFSTCIVSEVSGVHFLHYLLYYSDGKWVHIIGSVKALDGYGHEMGCSTVGK